MEPEGSLPLGHMDAMSPYPVIIIINSVAVNFELSDIMYISKDEKNK